MIIKFDIETYDKKICSRNWKLDTSKPPPASIGDSENGIIISNIQFEEEEEDGLLHSSKM